MKSLQLLALARMYLGRMDEFSKEQPHEWLIWEPGEWTPVSSNTVLVKTTQKTPAPGQSGLAIALDAERLVLGRADGCEIRLRDGTLSEKHLLFEKRMGNWVVADLAMKRTSWINGVPLGAN